jgi:hypothetical protein
MWKTHNKDKPLGQVVSYMSDMGEDAGYKFMSAQKTAKVTTLENTTIYHEIDFLLPAQRFNINFSYITQKGLPFVREFVLRLIHLGADVHVAGCNLLRFYTQGGSRSN